MTHPSTDGARRFPDGFVWGAATAAYQVEGAVAEDGRGRSIWDTFCATPGAIANGDTGDVACDHYHRYREDVALMAGLGLPAYRFSIAWPRIQPTGSGPVNQAGLDHYRRLVDELLAAGITPYVTLYHWDLPQALQDRGGWPARDTAYRFAEYVELVAAGLGDRVRHWITVNEPKVASHAGYGSGIHAPGIDDLAQRMAATHHLLLGHGLAVPILRRGGPDHEVGITLDLSPVLPAGPGPEDAAAAQREDGDAHRLFLDPVLRGRYPDDVVEQLGGPAAFEPFLRDGDLDLAAAELDFLGVNYYRPITVRAEPGAGRLGLRSVLPEGVPVTAVDWPVQPDGLRQLLVGLRDRYPELPPVYITENGAAFPDRADADGRVEDADRVAYLREHLAALHAAIAEGVDVRGYFVWTLMDNFEWAEGFDKRFGIVRVDYADQRRTPKDSARFFAAVVAANAVPDGAAAADGGSAD